MLMLFHWDNKVHCLSVSKGGGNKKKHHSPFLKCLSFCSMRGFILLIAEQET